MLTAFERPIEKAGCVIDLPRETLKNQDVPDVNSLYIYIYIFYYLREGSLGNPREKFDVYFDCREAEQGRWCDEIGRRDAACAISGRSRAGGVTR